MVPYGSYLYWNCGMGIGDRLSTAIPDHPLTRKERSTFLLVVLFLLGFGLVSMYSASYYFSTTNYGSPYYFIIRQSMFIMVGLFGALVAYMLPLQHIRTIIPLIMIISLGLMALTFTPLGIEVLGARRWISLGGYSFQPSEVLKISMSLYLANFLSRRTRRNFTPSTAVVPLGAIGLFSAIILMQNDLSSAAMLFFLGVSMLFVSEMPLKYIMALIGAALLAAALAILVAPHRIARILAYLKPEAYGDSFGYQVRISREAIAAGGILGRGVGQSTRKLGALPEMSSDFIFSIMAEEYGLLGVLGILVAFALVAYFGYTIARYRLKIGDPFGFYLAFGLTTSIVVQALVHMGVVSGLLPATGLPLPFFSQGGSSILITIISIGLLANVGFRLNPEERRFFSGPKPVDALLSQDDVEKLQQQRMQARRARLARMRQEEEDSEQDPWGSNLFRKDSLGREASGWESPDQDSTTQGSNPWDRGGSYGE